MLIHFGQSTYFRVNKGVDRYFLETYLLPGLEEQAVIAGGSRGIELPVGENQEPEYLSLEEGKALVLDWLEQSNNLLESDKKKLERIKNYEQFASLASNIYQAKVKDPNKLVNATRLQNVAELRASQKNTANVTPKYDPGKVIDDYNKLYLKLLSYSRVGIPQNLLRQIVTNGIPSGAGNLRQEALASVIGAHLPRLHAAGSVGSSEAAQNYAVARELGHIISTNYPEMTGLLNVLGDPQTAANLREATTRLAREFESEGNSLGAYEKIQTSAVSATDNYLLNQAEIRAQIQNSLPSMPLADRQALTTAILSEMVASSGQILTSQEIIQRVGQKINVGSSELAQIQSALRDSGVDVSLEYRQNELAVMVGTHHLTAGERNLLSKGINPFLTHHSPEKLASLESKLLAEYNATPGHNKKFVTLREAYANEQQANSPDLNFLGKTRAHFDQLDSYSNLSLSDRALVRRTKFGRWITDARSRYYETQSNFIDKWIDIEETITGKKLLHKWQDNWDGFAEKITIPGTKIPLFRIVPWLSDRIDEWKKVNTLNILKRTAGSDNWISKSIHWTFKQYELGGFTVNGATAHFASAQWGKAVKWGLAKTGMTGVVKYAGVSASRTATRFLLKIGGKTLAKFGAKAVGALLTAVTAVGSALFAISMVIDLVGLGWEFLKEFIRNSEFRKKIITFGAGITAFFATINLGGVFIAAGIIFASALSYLMIALTIIGIALFATSQIQTNIKLTFKLDSGVGQAIVGILCDESGGGENSTINTAMCIAKILSDCGINPLSSGNANSSKWQCALASVIADDVMAELKRSASSYAVLQCVGFVAAIDISTGGSGAFPDAKNMDTIHPSNYRFVAGVGSCSPGDIFVDKNGDWGHTGIFVALSGPTIKCVDANGGGPGVVRGVESCTWLSSKIAGCLKKM